VKRKGRTVRACLKEAWNELAGRRTGKAYEATPTRAGGLLTAGPKWPRVRRASGLLTASPKWLRVRRRRSGGVQGRSMSFGEYEPQAVLRREIPKSGGGTRELGIATVVDRLLQQAILQVLQPRWDTASPSAAMDSARDGERTMPCARRSNISSKGHVYVVDVDLLDVNCCGCG